MSVTTLKQLTVYSFFFFACGYDQVPQFRPQAALHMLEKLVKNEMLSPLLPTNSTLLNAGPGAFNSLMEEWTELARVPPYVGTKSDNAIKK